MLIGVSIKLRPWRDEDLLFLTSIRNDVVLQAGLMSRARGSRKEQVIEWLQGHRDNLNSMMFIISERECDQPRGYIQINDLNLLDAHAEMGICLIEEAQGKGLGGQAIKLIAMYLRDHWRVRKLILRVGAKNAAALKCYEKAGFERCGLLKQHVFISGEWQDLVLMEYFLLKDN